jgi:2-polyprenyl-3-methyl-5-hydroxy-6-metoxy-1,4-benzoquinol methylase
MFFDQYKEFVDCDVRSHRATIRVTTETLDKRCQALLPSWLVKDKTILDLGHCLGAFGHWALSNGAAHYTGVDIQQGFCDTSKELLSKYWTDDKFTIEQSETLEFLNKGNQYDIVIASGIIHCYFNSISFLEAIAKCTKEVIVIETQDADETDNIPSIQFKLLNMVSPNIGKPYGGLSSLVGFAAMRAIMAENGFELYGERIYPEKIQGTQDAYNDDIQTTTAKLCAPPKRYMVRYKRTRRISKTSLQYNVLNNVQRHNPAYVTINQVKIIKGETWKFDDNIASRFQEEATSNIPDYQRVIDMCQQIADKKISKKSVIVDVGSALGYTVDAFLNKGYENVHGVESSESMINNSKHKERIIFTESFPVMPVDFVMANWTLHFINERKKYIQDVYDNLNAGGVFILTDKTPQSDIIKDMYYDFKRSNGISNEYIYEKEKKLQGYMNLLPVQWYLDTLTESGFTNIQIINSKYGFVTFYGEKDYVR